MIRPYPSSLSLVRAAKWNYVPWQFSSNVDDIFSVHAGHGVEKAVWAGQVCGQLFNKQSHRTRSGQVRINFLLLFLFLVQKKYVSRYLNRSMQIVKEQTLKKCCSDQTWLDQSPQPLQDHPQAQEGPLKIPTQPLHCWQPTSQCRSLCHRDSKNLWSDKEDT